MKPKLIHLSLLLGLSLQVPAVAQVPDEVRVSFSEASGSTGSEDTAKQRQLRRLRQTFHASSELRPIARRLFEERTPAAFAVVEAYARRHTADQAGALANLALGYAHILDSNFLSAIAPLTKAKSRTRVLEEYAVYFLGTAYANLGDSKNVVVTLRDFDARYSDSPVLREAVVLYGNALIAEGQPREAAEVLEKRRQPAAPEIELALGRAYLKSGDQIRGARVLQQLRLAMPLSPQADEAALELSSLPPESLPEISLGQRKLRAQLLARGRRYEVAVEEYRGLISLAPAEEKPELELALGIALYRSGRRQQARELLENLQGLSGEVDSERLYYLLELARGEDDKERVNDLLRQIRETSPHNGWLQEALLSAGNMYLLAHDYDKAIDHYRELATRFPQGRHGAYAHWKAAWLDLRQQRPQQAKPELEKHLALYPDSPQVSAAIYWRGRIAEDEKDFSVARACYEKIISRFRHHYYAEMARERLRLLPSSPKLQLGFLDDLPVRSPRNGLPSPAPSNNIRLPKSRVLTNAGLWDFAVRELQKESEGLNWATLEMVRVYSSSGQYHRALQTLKKVVPEYYSLDFDALPRSYWEALFPKAYWNGLTRYALANGLDPYLVASLIRQESEFHSAAVSPANALGLMQLLPSTGRELARRLRMRSFSETLLTTPEVNLRLGTFHLRELLEKYEGKLEYALAAYNAGAHRVEDWLANGSYRDMIEFVESIPFSETRGYVQAIIRNQAVYKRLYSRISAAPKTPVVGSEQAELSGAH